MAVSSPTPLGQPSSADLSYRPFIRQSSFRKHSHWNTKRASPPPTAPISANPSLSRPMSVGDSSDDELPEPMEFSALTKALLNEEASVLDTSLPPADKDNGGRSILPPVNGLHDLGQDLPRRRDSSPESLASKSTAPRRVVRLSGGSAGTATRRRSTSPANVYPTHLETTSRDTNLQDLITPAPRPRIVHVRRSPDHSGGTSMVKQEHVGSYIQEIGGETQAPANNIGRALMADPQESALRYGSITTGRPKPSDDSNGHGSLRVKRVGKVSGSFLSGPARRGRRRQSEEDPSPVQDNEHPSVNGMDEQGGHENPQETAAVDKVGSDNGEVNKEFVEDPASRHNIHHLRLDLGSHARDDQDVGVSTSTSSNAKKAVLQPSSSINKSSSALVHPVFKVPPPPPSLPSMNDQENDPPPTFRRNKPFGSILQPKIETLGALADGKGIRQISASNSPERRALAPRSQNTPQRPAPPPPRMSVLETATASAGAATTSQSRKKRNHVTVNGKLFTRLDCIGRGGSSRVYRVMAENYKVFALKKVALADVDEVTIRGYKGEIDLLRKLDHADRAIKLFDWEVNEEKQTLSVLMEFGELDLRQLLTFRLNAENAKFDISFARYYWKEMLECVQSVHEYGIVHSDLKPANFLLVKGRLKLIDFGIASAIQDDTVNVHREQLVGTPNYISPEAIVDTNSKGGPTATAGKIMKLGKPSDVWSLGCILYQMVYGQPPFASISNPMQRIMAIPNPTHIIDFPSNGVGGVAVPIGLIRTLKGCLTRDQVKRPTIEQLLHDRDPFLYPDAEREDVVEVSQEVLGRVLANVVNHCQTVGIPTEAELSSWPAGFFTRIKKALREEG